jgi:hypothetical protein
LDKETAHEEAQRLEREDHKAERALMVRQVEAHERIAAALEKIVDACGSVVQDGIVRVAQV